MDFIADLHLHSRFSRATSPLMGIRNIHDWACLKGIGLIGTGDFTHPLWIDEIEEQLEPAETGLYKLKNNTAAGTGSREIPASCRMDVRFMLSAEVSLIYKKAGKCRKVHHLLYLPDIASVRRFNVELEKNYNIGYDGRPILGMDSKSLLTRLLDASPIGMMVPAHAWTPHFSIFGSKTGFDSISECFEEMSGHITAIETGLSSDPAMNRLISRLDDTVLVSNSDAHSLENIGREANLFSTEFSYRGVANALKKGDGLVKTYEFFPHEGQYHYDGHRKCSVRTDPKESRRLGNICPGCGGKLTLGVLHRVEELADREKPAPAAFQPLVPLMEILAESIGVSGAKGKKVTDEYFRLTAIFGSEFKILTAVTPQELAGAGYEKLGLAIKRMREGKVSLSPGYDGVYGKVKVFD